MAQRGAPEDSGTGDPSFCRTYEVHLESEDLGGQADSGSEGALPAATRVGSRGQGGCRALGAAGVWELRSPERTHSPSVWRWGAPSAPTWVSPSRGGHRACYSGTPSAQELSTAVTPPWQPKPGLLPRPTGPTGRSRRIRALWAGDGPRGWGGWVAARCPPALREHRPPTSSASPVSETLPQEDAGLQLEPAPGQGAERPDREL